MSDHVPAIEEMELLPEMTWAQTQAMNPRCSYQSRTNTYTWSVDISEDVWLVLKRIPRRAFVDLPIRWYQADTDPNKGPFGWFWNRMHKKGIFASLDLRQVLGIDGGDEDATKAKLREVFDVTSMTFVSPDQFYEWATGKELHGCAAIARQQSQFEGR